MDERKDRLTTVVLGLIVQLAVSLALAPWDAASEREFYGGVKIALAIGLLANVVVRLVRMLWAGRTTASRPQARTPQDAARGEIGVFWYLLIALAFALVILMVLVGIVRTGLV
jgi:hypothetical protein